jgi:hypothetical protein
MELNIDANNSIKIKLKRANKKFGNCGIRFGRSHTLLNGTKVAWRLLDNIDYDELMSRRLWQEVSKAEDLLRFDF